MRARSFAATVLIGVVFLSGAHGVVGAGLPISGPASKIGVLVGDVDQSYDLLGFKLGMLPDEVIAVAKAAGWKYRVRQGTLPSATAYVDQITVDAPFQTTVEFSAATETVVRVGLRGTTVGVLVERDQLYQAAVAKWGEPLPHRGDDRPRYLVWKDRNGFHPTYSLAMMNISEPASLSLSDEPARTASTAFLKGPPRPKPSL